MNKDTWETLNDIANGEAQPPELGFDEAGRILDYIEELQQSIEWWKDKFFGQQTYDDAYRITARVYNKRIHTAIEYIKQHTNDGAECLYVEKAEELLNILNGEEDVPNND